MKSKKQGRRAMRPTPQTPPPAEVADLSARIAAQIVPRDRPDKDSQVVFAFRCDKVLRDAIHAAADARGLSATNFVIQVLRIATATPTK